MSLLILVGSALRRIHNFSRAPFCRGFVHDAAKAHLVLAGESGLPGEGPGAAGEAEGQDGHHKRALHYEEYRKRRLRREQSDGVSGLLLDYKGDGEIKLNCDKPVRARQFHPGLSTPSAGGTAGACGQLAAVSITFKNICTCRIGAPEENLRLLGGELAAWRAPAFGLRGTACGSGPRSTAAQQRGRLSLLGQA